MTAIVATLLTVSGMMRVWVESPMVRIFPNSAPTAALVAEASLHAAQGERESFQICIKADKNPLKQITVEAEGLAGDKIPAPEIRRVGYISVPTPRPAQGVATAKGTDAVVTPEEWFPDPLLDFAEFSLGPGETAAVWVTYDVPRDARPGDYHGSVTVRIDGKKRNVRVSLEVFGFALPEMPSLRTAFPLNRDPIASAYGIPNDSLDKWKPIYDALAHERISFRVWEGDGLVNIPKEGPPDTALLKEHIEYAVNAAHMNGIDIGAGPSGVSPWPPPKEETLQDPMQYYLHDMGNWLQDQGWLSKAYIEPMPLPARAQWQEARDTYFRVKRNDNRIKRLLAGAGDPYFERYTDIYATPLAQFDPYVDAALRHGVSLSFKQKSPAKAVTASASGAVPGDPGRVTAPEDAYDGCLFTYWMSKEAMKKSKPRWLQVDLKKSVTTDKVKIIWKRGFESSEVRLTTLLDGIENKVPEVRWQTFAAASPFTQSWVEATLPAPVTFDGMRIEFTEPFHNNPIGVTEVVFGEAPDVDPPAQIEPIEEWLTSADGCFPSFGIHSHPVEARMMPWVCWGHQSVGFVHRGLCQWPKGWAALVAEQPVIWPTVDSRKRGKGTSEADDEQRVSDGAEYLFYPGKNGPIPSIRSETLRDGMEDYEYLVLLDQALAEGKSTIQNLNMPDLANLIARRLYAPDPQDRELDGMSATISKGRIRMGWAITAMEKKK